MTTKKFIISMPKDNEDHVPKFRSLDSSWVLFHPMQKIQLDMVAKEIMRYRLTSREHPELRERITANMLIRCLVKHFLRTHKNLEMDAMFREEDVEIWVWKLFRE